MGLHDDVMRVLTLKVKAHSETPSAMLQNAECFGCARRIIRPGVL